MAYNCHASLDGIFNVDFNIETQRNVSEIGDTITINGVLTASYFVEDKLDNIWISLDGNKDGKGRKQMTYAFPTPIGAYESVEFTVSTTLGMGLIGRDNAVQGQFPVYVCRVGVGDTSGHSYFSSSIQGPAEFIMLDDWQRPKFANLPTITDTNTMTTEYFGVLVQGKSKLKFAINVSDMVFDPRYAGITTGYEFKVRILSADGTVLFEKSINQHVLPRTITMPSEIDVAGDITIQFFLADVSVWSDEDYSVSEYVYEYSAPTIESFNVARYEAYIDDNSETKYREADDGTSVWLSMVANVSSIAGKNAWKLEYSLYPDMANSIEFANGTDGRSITYKEDRSMIYYEFLASSNYTIYVRLTDVFGTVSVEDEIVSAECPLHVAPYGVCVGGISQSNETSPKFECYYPAYFYGGIMLGGGLGDYPASGTEQKTSVKWVDGKPIYRAALVGSVTTSGRIQLPQITPCTTIDTIIGISGTAVTPGGSDFMSLPHVNYAGLAYCVGVRAYKNGSGELYIGSQYSKGVDYVIITEYTKTTDEVDESLLTDSEGYSLTDASNMPLAAADEIYRLSYTGAQIDQSIARTSEMYTAFSDGSLKGDDGVSPSVAVTPITGGNRVTITDANGEKSFDVMNGTNGGSGDSGGGSINTATIVDLIYPVGSIYMSVNSVSPATLFGGTWEQIKDTFLLSAGDTYASGTSGGNAEHTHDASGYALITASGTAGLAVQSVGSIEAWETNMLYTTSKRAELVQSRTAGVVTKTTIENASNIPPYLTVNMWKRTA